MPQQMVSAIESTFLRGLITEATGLNFPEGAATDCDNVTFTITGDVLRRAGIDFEEGSQAQNLGTRLGNAVSTFIWDNAGGDGVTKLLVVQNGGTLYFFDISSTDQNTSLSSQMLAGGSGNIVISNYTAVGGTFDPSIECQYASGNGYLFVFNSNCDTIYISYSAGTVTAAAITLQIRDLDRIPETIPDNYRPSSLSAEHKYNIQNQGWSAANPWSSASGTVYDLGTTGSFNFTIATGLTGPVVGTTVQVYYTGAKEFITVGGYNGYIYTGDVVATATISSYTSASGVLAVDITSVNFAGLAGEGVGYSSWNIVPGSSGPVSTFLTATSTYPSNADVWWYFKDSTGTFSPSTTINDVTLSIGKAPAGHYVYNPFNIDRSLVSGISGLTTVTTSQRPSTGCWFQGRVWYTGIQASQTASGDAPYYSWSENIYFSQISVGSSNNFANCYQNNDPTSEELFDIISTDGGVIQIVGSGVIKKLFPIQNGLLVFAQNGVWFITGSTGIGFAADDYTITKISSVETLSAHSFVDVLGLPYFWNLEGIYKVQPMGNGGGLEVTPITVNTIKTFYNNIPNVSKRYARGCYNPIDYTIQWLYKTTSETSVTDRYAFDGMLNMNTYTKAFFPYSIANTNPSINSIFFFQPTETGSSIDPVIKYVCSVFQTSYMFTFADEHDINYVDWATSSSSNYGSYFVTGYNSPNMFSPSTMDRSKGIGKFQAPYVFTYSRSLDQPTAFYLQSVWDFGVAQDSNRWSSKQLISTYEPNYGMVVRRSRLRGMGLVMQIKISSVDGMPFDIMGWTLSENVNARP